MCSEYLLSGFSGVPNEAFTASSSFPSHLDFSPSNARLYFERFNSASGWCAEHINSASYVQAELEREAVVNSVHIQGRGDYVQWVTTFYILYSLDGVVWTYAKAPDNNDKIFTGNSDSNTVVKNAISPPIKGKFFRINARSWYNRPCLRFDLGGCINQAEHKGSQYKQASVSSVTLLGQSILLQPSRTYLHHCGFACHRSSGCVAFTFDGAICLGYNFYNSVQRIPGYKQAETGEFSYKFIEMRQNKDSASALCLSHGSLLMKIDTQNRLAIVQVAIQENNLLKQDVRFYVSGHYTTQWQYSDGDVIESNLWSPSNPDPRKGHCVMLTQSGLSSVDCNTLLFFICGN
ncbi:uncharacterized protein [Argopecten irradians]|uniref:uncharacterized protein n=1 Tax=Argopecten irradians TaxID=31199 RepID=UPI00370FAC9F